jgi:hypothetical protein
MSHSKLYPCFCKAYKSFPIGLRRIQFFFLSIWLCHANSQSHILQATSLIPYLSYHRAIRKLKWLTELPNCLSSLILLLLEWCAYVVLLLSYSFTESYVFCWENYTIINYSKRQVTLHQIPIIFYVALVLSKMHV